MSKTNKYEEDDKKIIESNSFKDDSNLSTKDVAIVFGVLVIGLILFSMLFKFIF
ncbi:hypothetical protein [Peptoniphilus sp.]|jgi:hypothetical protein|uniref:hypothetical protein n=1 Tax=Peptoniphilus sp. TaxID=1971214 RepID=UPI003D8B6AA8